MPCSCCGFVDLADQQFTRKKVVKELRSYRRKGPEPTTRLLRDSLANAGVAGATVLDIGAGIGALTFELLKLGARRATVVEAAPAYLAAATEEASRADKRDVIEFKHADFLTIAPELPAAAVVALDRVICCYPYYEPFLVEALRHADRVFAMSYPRDRWFVRLAVGLENAMRKRGCSFRTFVHPVAEMERIIRQAGFELTSRKQTAVWSADVFVRRSGIFPIAAVS